MSAFNGYASGNVVTDHQHWLARHRALEIELMQARQSHRGLKRQTAAAAAIANASEDTESDAWMMTYLDMMTLLLVVTMAMLAMAGRGHDHPHQGDFNLSQIFNAKELTRLDPPGALLLAPQAKTAVEPKPEPTPEPITATEAVAPDLVASVATTIEVPAPEPATVIPAPPAPVKPSVEDLLNELPLDKLGSDIEVVASESAVSFRISSEIIFPSGQSDLNLGGLRVLQRLIPILESVPHKVIVAGHTDTQDIRSSRFPSNWELSSARAGSVVRYLQSNGISSDRLTAVGYADTRPLGDNSTTQGRARNRRVEFILER
ncbi:OmpA family protein [Pseudomonas brassicacearum]|uniref:OmpA family protein n=1 Tax=Pseudomonas brassicacearum TaxID=930166 RepID=A0AAJ3FVN8_9PSED|nr:OmpA family protein [Pseudomonas brassicacearum]NUT81624.1 OmpA family protein [Pseudomonas brassicacearum]